MKKAKEASTRPTMNVCARARNHDCGGEDVVPPVRGVVADEERGCIVAEGDGDHRADDDHRRDVAEPGGDADETALPEPFHQVGDQPARGRVAAAELDADVREQGGHGEAEEERDPDCGSGELARRSEQREDAGADHGADSEHRRARHRHLLGRRRPRVCGLG
jgi:hypothetical protein